MEKYVVFQLEEERYGIHIDKVLSIELPQPITKVPGSEDYIKGVLTLRGNLTPVLDMRTYFKLPTREYQLTKIIVVFDDDIQLGLIVDDANVVMDIPEESIEPLSKVMGKVGADYFKGLAKLESGTIGILNLEYLLNIAKAHELISK